MAEMGRPRKEFDWKLLESHARNQSTEAFAAEVMLIAQGIEPNKTNVSAQVKLIQRRLRERWDIGYVEFVEQKKQYVKSSLRGWQLKAASEGNVTMQIWLGKQYLDQKDKSSQEISGPDGKPLGGKPEITDEQLEAKIKEYSLKYGLKIE